MNRNPLDLIVSSYFISTSGILGVVHKCLWGSMHKIGCEEGYLQVCPVLSKFPGCWEGRMRAMVPLGTLDSSADWLR